MTPQEFIHKWKRTNLSERSAYQQHFLDLCELLNQPKPAAEDPDGAFFRARRPQNGRLARLGRCLVPRPFRLGVQEEAQEPPSNPVLEPFENIKEHGRDPRPERPGAPEWPAACELLLKSALEPCGRRC